MCEQFARAEYGDGITLMVCRLIVVINQMMAVCRPLTLELFSETTFAGSVSNGISPRRNLLN